jgi:hypothetical protein
MKDRMGFELEVGDFIHFPCSIGGYIFDGRVVSVDRNAIVCEYIPFGENYLNEKKLGNPDYIIKVVSPTAQEMLKEWFFKAENKPKPWQLDKLVEEAQDLDMGYE